MKYAISFILATMMFCSCSNSYKTDDFIGTWLQEYSDPSNGMSGYELISLVHGGTMTNTAQLEYVDSIENLRLHLDFKVTVPGRWDFDEKKQNLSLMFIPHETQLDINPDNIVVTNHAGQRITLKDEDLTTLSKELEDQIFELFVGRFSSLPCPVLLSNLTVTDTSMKGNLAGSFIQYTKYEPK